MYPNKSMIYQEYTPYLPTPGKHLLVKDRPFDPKPPTKGATVKNLYISLDPYYRGQMRLPTDPGTYSAPWILGEPAMMTGLAEVVESDNQALKPGDLVSAPTRCAEYAVVPAELIPQVQVLPPLPPGVDIAPETLVHILGVPGWAAYVSFYEYVAEPFEGKTIFISAASGAVGQIVGQIAKLHGMRVLGSTGSADKVEFVTGTLGYDAAWDYHSEKTADALARLAPDGLDVYYDNVGGEQLEAAVNAMKDFGLIIASGACSQYNLPWEECYGVRSLMILFLRRLTIRGFICSDPVFAKYKDKFVTDMVTWVAQGKIKTKSEVTVGIDGAVEALVRMWKGDKLGKAVLQVCA
ncbi:hypothetical protein FHL15_007386 [Xylaria flabelliformis]|uniref:Dehydrogenase FUB6 n=1 Tax=Xylaria flabelliformis TaxID=2512241 RepID=A0A553HV79_9PEZI|nr:hypothetical protein FHL15_007386 [Xylaria flabelliformis]